MRNEYVLSLHRIKNERNFLHTMKRMKDNRIVHIWRRNCLVKHVIEGEIEEGLKLLEDENEDVSSY